MLLALYFLILLAIEIPVTTLFFKKKKKGEAAKTCLLINLFTWPIIHILFYNTSIEVFHLHIGVVIVEGFGYWILLKCGWSKGFAISLVTNILTYCAALLIGIQML